MTAKNLLTDAPPYDVERAIRRLGQDMRIARLRRNMTVNEVADRIGTGPRAVMDAEKGKPSTGIAVYVALLWAYDLLNPFEALADPQNDSEGIAFDRLSSRKRARSSKGLDNDF